MTSCVPLGRYFKEMKLTYPDGVCTVYAVEGVRAENAVYAETVCSMMEHGCEPWRWIEGGEADEPCWARVMEHGCEPWRWKEGGEAGWRIDVQDRCGAVHSGLVAVAATTCGDDENASCRVAVEPGLRTCEDRGGGRELGMAVEDVNPASVDAVVWRVRLWTKMNPRCVAVNGSCGQAMRCNRRPAPGYVGVQPLCCNRRRTCRCVCVPSVSGCVGDETALNMHALRACWSAECCMYRHHESPGGCVAGTCRRYCKLCYVYVPRATR